MATKDRIFLAHASEDKPQVRQFYHRLKDRGFSPWLDDIDLIPGQDWREEIPKAIRDARVCLIFFSSNSVSKPSFIQAEFRYAMAAYAQLPPGSIYLIPVRLDECEIPDIRIASLDLNARDLQWVDIFAEGAFEKLLAAIDLATEISTLPDQGAGVRFQINEQGRIDSARDPNSNTNLDRAPMQTLQEELVAACDEFIGCFDEGFGQNAFGYLINHTRRYRDVVSAPLESLQFNLAYLLGTRLQKVRDAVSRSDIDRLNPSLEDDQQAALDTILSFHGIFVLSSEAGQDLHAKANAYQATRDDIQKLGEAARQLKEAVFQTKEFVTDDVREVIDHAVSEIGQGRFPEREAVVAETTIGNFLLLVGKASLFTAAAAAGGIVENAVVDSLLGKDLVGLGVNAINVAGASAKQFLLQHQIMLKGLAAASNDSLAWLPHFIEWLKSRPQEGGDDQTAVKPSSAASFHQRKPFEVSKDIDASWCPEMILLPAGKFLMGSPENEKGRSDREGPQHEVTISKPFLLGRYVVTFDEYDHFCAATGREKPDDRGWGRGRHPVIHVSHDDALAYCAWLSEATGRPYKLPTEAQWEYACRAGTTAHFSFGANITTDQVNFTGKESDYAPQKGTYRGRTVPVGSLRANDWGLHEMHGNVWEWCADWLGRYPSTAVTDPQGPASGKRRVVRGGSWDGYTPGTRAATRFAHGPEGWSRNLGFRCVGVQGA